MSDESTARCLPSPNEASPPTQRPSGALRPRYQSLDSRRVGLMTLKPGAPEGLRVTCFPFAGGGPLSFQALAASLPDAWCVSAIDPPGHVRTAGEPLWTVEEMVELYLRVVPPELLEGALLVGHSLGGYVALGIASQLEARGRPAAALVIGAAQPLHRRDPALPLTHMTDEALFEWVSSLDGLPSGPSEQREFFDIFKDAIRADVTAFEAFRAPAHPLSRTPVLGLSGRYDPIYPSGTMGEWARDVSRLTVQELPGAHLFVMTEAEQMAAQLVDFAHSLGLGRGTPS